MTRIALFPGTFDPPTLGHLDVIKRAPLVCEKLIVAVGENSSKTTAYPVEQRLAMLQAATRRYPYAEAVSFSGLAVEYAKERKVSFLLRGIRSMADYEQELRMAEANRQMSGIETVFFLSTSPHITSTIVREIAHFGGPLAGFVPPEIESLLLL